MKAHTRPGCCAGQGNMDALIISVAVNHAIAGHVGIMTKHSYKKLKKIRQVFGGELLAHK